MTKTTALVSRDMRKSFVEVEKLTFNLIWMGRGEKCSPGIIPKLTSLPIEYELVYHKNDKQLSRSRGPGPLALTLLNEEASDTVGLLQSCVRRFWL